MLAPESARRAIREMFLAHVIGGKGLSRRADFTAMVQGPTPDLVLTGVEVLAAEVGGGGVVVVDVGGATTDVHSVVPLDPEEAGLSREVVAVTPVTRTVEGDLGHALERAQHLGGRARGGPGGRGPPGRRRTPGTPTRPSSPPRRPSAPTDLRIAATAATLAVRRHVGRSRVVIGPDGRVVERSGKDLREVDLLVGSGGVLRHAPADEATGAVLGAGHRPEPRGVAAAGAPAGGGRPRLRAGRRRAAGRACPGSGRRPCP